MTDRRIWTRTPKSGARRKYDAYEVDIIDTTPAGFKVIEFVRRYRTIQRVVHPRSLT